MQIRVISSDVEVIMGNIQGQILRYSQQVKKISTQLVITLHGAYGSIEADNQARKYLHGIPYDEVTKCYILTSLQDLWHRLPLR